MNPQSVDIKDMLEADSSLGLTFATNLFVGKEPKDPDECATIFDVGGFPEQLTLAGKDETYQFPSVQIRVRSDSYVNGMNLIQDIGTSLHGRAQETWNGTLYTVIYIASGPALLDWDESDRPRFIINFNLQRR